MNVADWPDLTIHSGTAIITFAHSLVPDHVPPDRADPIHGRGPRPLIVAVSICGRRARRRARVGSSKLARVREPWM
jgi:hypothetical protein